MPERDTAHPNEQHFEDDSRLASILDALDGVCPEIGRSVFRGQVRIVVPVERSFDVCSRLASAGFDLLVDVSCVDYLDYRNAKRRFGLVYLLASTRDALRLTVRVFVDEPVDSDPSGCTSPTVPSVVPIWEAADWLEREVWDLFGIRFEGHPDLRRLVMPEEFSGHPLRKDYPLQGRGERHNFPVITRENS
ncbi:MAG: NADH-quinone oxidoreductase subunit C [Planctomycetaceae bacterium]